MNQLFSSLVLESEFGSLSRSHDSAIICLIQLALQTDQLLGCLGLTSVPPKTTQCRTRFHSIIPSSASVTYTINANNYLKMQVVNAKTFVL
jgi:hypothetical protein